MLESNGLGDGAGWGGGVGRTCAFWGSLQLQPINWEGLLSKIHLLVQQLPPPWRVQSRPVFCELESWVHEALCPSPGTFQGFLVASSLAFSREFLISPSSAHDIHASKDPRIPDSGLGASGPSRLTGAGHWSPLALVAHVDWMTRGLRVTAWPGGRRAVHVGSPTMLRTRQLQREDSPTVSEVNPPLKSFAASLESWDVPENHYTGSLVEQVLRLNSLPVTRRREDFPS